MKNQNAATNKINRSINKIFRNVSPNMANPFVSIGTVAIRRFNFVKRNFLQRMFWGRGSGYKNTFHMIVVILTILLVQTGIATTQANAIYSSEALELRSGIYGNTDILLQGESISSVIAIEQITNFDLIFHVVEKKDTIKSLAKKYKVTENTIVWANEGKIDYYNRKLTPGDKLKIPPVNGVLLSVKKNDTVDSALKRVNNGNRFDVIELNQLSGPKYSLKGKSAIFIPAATKDAPPEPDSLNPFGTAPANYGYIPSPYTGAAIGGLPAGFFDDPLTHPSCAGYGYGRGYRPGGLYYGHTGVDLTKSGGCSIRAIGSGTVTFAGWSDSGSGISVGINHGGGVSSHYYHGSEVWVRTGQHVNKGDLIMRMGCTGYCNGTHLHLTLRLNGNAIDPAPYVPYRR